MKPGSKPFYRLTKPVVFLVCVLPMAWLLLRAFEVAGFALGANPIEALLHQLGLWGLRFLLLSLSVTPLRHWTGWAWLIRYRRLLGLFAFFYILLHFLTYSVLDQSLEIGLIIEDVIEHPYITLGMVGLLLLLPLALTSTKGMMRRMGKRWQKLHRLVYVVALAGVWHFYWQVKLDTFEAAIYILILTILLGTRLYYSKCVYQRVGR